MGDITRNISRHEQACKCGCGFDACDMELMNLLQGEVDDYQKQIGDKGRVIIVFKGGNRCLAHNETVQTEYYLSKGLVYEPFSSDSPHMRALAADFKLFVIWKNKTRTQIAPNSIHSRLRKKYPDKHGFGLYSNRNHADIRDYPAEWEG